MGVKIRKRQAKNKIYLLNPFKQYSLGRSQSERCVKMSPQLFIILVIFNLKNLFKNVF